MKLATCVLTGTALLLGGCTAGERSVAPRPTAVRSERDIHAAAARSHPGRRAWEDASRRALRSGLEIAPSFRERVAFQGGDAQAVAYRFTLVRGQSLRVQLAPLAGTTTVFADMFQFVGGDMFRPVHWAEKSARSGRFVARSDGEYVLRVQPPIGARGTVDVSVLSEASLVFPVAGADHSAIGSVIGDPRDNGARSHEGVDIFAPRGTAVVAVADGRIQKSRNTPTGGLVIWQADAASSLTYYYAHLDELVAREGAYVRAGDVIGRVGNTGNARGTRPHLHFAVYRPGTVPVDPVPMLAARHSEPGPGLGPVDGRSLGALARVNSDGVRLRRSPSIAGAVIGELSTGTQLRVIGATGEWQRVLLPDGTSGFVAADVVESSYAGTR